MGKIIAVAQHKGGTGKTTTCINLGASLCDMGKIVLVIDLDPQASLTLSLGINPLEVEKSIHEGPGGLRRQNQGCHNEAAHPQLLCRALPSGSGDG